VSISEVASFVGLLLGTVGTVLGIMNFLRDRGKLVVRLQWDMAMTGEHPDKRVGCITVTNTGRRASYMSHVALRLPKGGETSHFLIREGLKGQKLYEGDPPVVFTVDQDGLEAYAGRWREVLAQVSDSTGRVWASKPVAIVPSWAKTPNNTVERGARKSGARPSP
jgi:hypothetical protein